MTLSKNRSLMFAPGPNLWDRATRLATPPNFASHLLVCGRPISWRTTICKLASMTSVASLTSITQAAGCPPRRATPSSRRSSRASISFGHSRTRRLKRASSTSAGSLTSTRPSSTPIVTGDSALHHRCSHAHLRHCQRRTHLLWSGKRSGANLARCRPARAKRRPKPPVSPRQHEGETSAAAPSATRCPSRRVCRLRSGCGQPRTRPRRRVTSSLCARTCRRL